MTIGPQPMFVQFWCWLIKISYSADCLVCLRCLLWFYLHSNHCYYFIVFIALLSFINFFFFYLCSNSYPEGSVTNTDDDNERVDAAEEETDEDDHTFFDTRDFLSSSSFKSNGSDFRTSSSFSSDDEGINAVDSEDDTYTYIKSVGSNFPYIKRRKKLPDPVEKEKGVSLWSMIKDNIGKDLTKVCLPVYFNEPLSSLQKCFEDLEYSYLLDRAYEWGKRVSL